MRRLIILPLLLFVVKTAYTLHASPVQEPDGVRVVDTTFVFEAEHFPISFHERRHYTHHSFWPVNDDSYVWLKDGVRDDVFIPWLSFVMELQPYYELLDFSFERNGERLFLEDAMVYIVGRSYVLADDYPSDPDTFVHMTGIYKSDLWNGWCKIPFLICPFRYEASTSRLYLSESITLRVRIRQHDFSYRPFIEDGKTWIYGREKDRTKHGSINGTYDELEYLYFGGDTIVGGQRCRLWMCDTHSLVDPSAPVVTKLLAPVFEESQKVFFFYPGQVVPSLLYDFSNPDQERRITVFHITSSPGIPEVCTRDAGEKVYSSKMYITPGVFYLQRNWLEGVGVEWFRSYADDYNGTYWLLLCQVGNQKLFWRTWENQYITGITDLQQSKGVLESSGMSKKPSSRQIFDLSGRRLAAPPARGLYIEDGRVRGGLKREK